MKKVPLSKLLQSAAERMSLDLRQQLVPHPGELGTAREQIVRDFLKSHLPKRFDIGTGFAFDCDGNVSSQLDLVIFDAMVCPRFEMPGGKFLFPCEAIIAVGQIKSHLTSRDELTCALDNLVSVKVLDRSARGHAYDTKHQEKLDPTSNHLHQIFTFLFITEKSLDPNTIAEILFDRAYKSAIDELPNVIVSLDKYLVTYCCDHGICPNPMNARGIAIQSASESFDVLLRFYLMLGMALDTIRTASFPYWEYLQKYRDLEAKVLYSTVDNPPPYLGN